MKKLFTLICAAIMALGLNAADGKYAFKAANAAPNQKVALRHFDGKIVPNAKPDFKFDLQRTPMHHNAARKAANVALENVNFTLTMGEITATTAEATITPNDNTAPYMFSCVPSAAYDTLTETDIAANFQEAMDYYISMYAMYEITLTYADFASMGQITDTLSSLDPATEYVLFAYLLDTSTGLASSAFDTIHFTTESIPMSDNVITMNYINDTLYITTTNDDPYFFIFESQDDYDYYQSDLSDESIKAELEEWIEQADQYSMLGYLTFSGDTAFSVADFYSDIFGKDLTSDDYISMAAPFIGLINGDVAYHQFYYTEPIIVCTDTASVHIINPSWTDKVDTYGWWQVMGAESADSAYYVSLSNSETEVIPGTYAKEDMDMEYSFIYVGETKVSFSTLTVTITEEDESYIIAAEGAGKNSIYYRITFDTIHLGCTDTVDVHIINPTWNESYFATQGWWQVIGAESTDTVYYVSLSNSSALAIPGTYATEDMDLDYSFVYTGGGQVSFTALTVTIKEENDFYIITAEGAGENQVYYRFTFDAIPIGGTAIEEVAEAIKGESKVMMDGKLYIVKDGKMFDVLGCPVK